MLAAYRSGVRPRGEESPLPDRGLAPEGAQCAMTKKIACFAGALALVAGSALAQKSQAEKGNDARVDRKEIKQDRRAAERNDDRKHTAEARSEMKDQARIRREYAPGRDARDPLEDRLRR